MSITENTCPIGGVFSLTTNTCKTCGNHITQPCPRGVEAALELAAEDFIEINSENLNEFQVDTIRVVFAKDSGPDEYAALLAEMDREARLLDSIEFTPYSHRGDKVVRPVHYDLFEMEPTFFNMANTVDWCRGNILKYVCRYRHKNGTEDIRKAARYLAMFIKFLDGDPNWSK